MAGTWQGLLHQPTFNTSTMILLSDARIMVQEEATQHWHALTPDHHGSYVYGTWSPLADMSFWRRYYASGMLKAATVVTPTRAKSTILSRIAGVLSLLRRVGLRSATPLAVSCPAAT